MSTSDKLDREPLIFSYNSPDDSIPSADEIISSLNWLKGDLGQLSDLITEEGQIVNDLFQTLMKLTQLLQWAPVDTSILPMDMGEVERAHVTPEGTLIVCRVDGEIETIDLSEYERRDILVEVVRDLAPKLREILENPPKPKEPFIEKLEPLVEKPSIEEPKVSEPPIEKPAIEEPILEKNAEIEDTVALILKEESVIEESEYKPEMAEERKEIIKESIEPAVLKPPKIEKSYTEKPQFTKDPIKKKSQRVNAKPRNVDLLWSILIGQRKDSLQEIKTYRLKRERENSMLLRSLRKLRDRELVKQRGLFDQLKFLLQRLREKKE